MLLREFTQQGEIALTRQDKPHVARNRLDDNCGDVLPLALHDGTNGILIVVRDGNCIGGSPLRHARRTRHAKRRHPRAGTDEQTVAVSMVTADELHNLIAPRIAACKTECTHRRLRPRVHHANNLNGRIDSLHELCKLRFEERRCTVACTARCSLLKCLYYLRMGMTDNHRPP